MKTTQLLAAVTAAASMTLLAPSVAGAASVPSAPRQVVATAGDASATVTWDAPSSDGGDAIVSYSVTSSPGNIKEHVGPQARTATVTGLTNGTTYTFTVHATNDEGNGPESSPSNAVTPRAAAATVPGAPRAVNASPGNGDALVSWTAPASSGSSAITSYVVTSSPGGRTATAGGAARSATVDGLTNGTSYTFTVRATNAAGTGPASSASPAVVAGAPDAPGGLRVTTADRRATVSWSAPAANGSAITAYTVTASPGGASVNADDDARSATITGLANGTTYTFSVRARNARGAGPASTIAATVRPADAVRRLAGGSRIETAIEVSEDTWERSAAQAVVLARSDGFADALAGAPLAARKGGPLLLTPPTTLDEDVRDEIDRVLTDGRTVYVLGGAAAISRSIEEQLEDDGFDVVRFAGDDRFGTAAEIADEGLGNPATVFLVTGLDYPDALAAGAAAAKVGGAVLLTNGRSVGDTTDDYLDDHDPSTVYTVGGPASDAYDDGEAIVGDDRYETAVEVAEELFSGAGHVGIASGRDFADALTGSVHIARRGGPLLLVGSTLPSDVGDYLDDRAGTITTAHVYGGTGAVSSSVADDVRKAIT